VRAAATTPKPNRPTRAKWFIGTVMKSGETFVLRHASGKIYDVDHRKN
jgi:hypothetical protein